MVAAHRIVAEVAVPGTIEETGNDEAIKTHRIPLYKVIFLNDNITTMDFVVYILIALFKKDRTTAVSLMLEVHQKGSTIVDILPLEEAELRQHQVHNTARAAGFPLRCLIEPA